MNARQLGLTMAAAVIAAVIAGCATGDSSSQADSGTKRNGHWIYVNETGSHMKKAVWVDDTTGTTNSQSEVHSADAGALQGAQAPTGLRVPFGSGGGR